MSMKLFYIYIIFLCSFLYSSTSLNEDSLADSSHISLIIHEKLLNDFFNNIGEIKGNVSSPIVYEWYLLNPRIEINPGESFFFAQINAKTDYFSITRDVNGSVSVSYDKEANVIEIAIVTAKVILDVDLFGKNVVLGEIDVAKHFSKSLTFDGPKSFNNQIEFSMPNDKIKKMNVITESYQILLLEDAIQLITILDFKEDD